MCQSLYQAFYWPHKKTRTGRGGGVEEIIFTPPFCRWRKRGSESSKVTAWNWGSQDVNPGSPTPDPAALNRPLREVILSPPPSALYVYPSKLGVYNISTGAGLSGPALGEQNNPCVRGQVGWTLAGPELRGRSPHSFAHTVSPEPSGRRSKRPARPGPPHDLGSTALLRASVSPPQPPAGGLSRARARGAAGLSHAPLSRPLSRPAYAGRRPLQGRPPSPSASVASLPPPPAARVPRRHRRRTCSHQARQPQRSRYSRCYRRR